MNSYWRYAPRGVITDVVFTRWCVTTFPCRSQTHLETTRNTLDYTEWNSNLAFAVPGFKSSRLLVLGIFEKKTDTPYRSIKYEWTAGRRDFLANVTTLYSKGTSKHANKWTLFVEKSKTFLSSLVIVTLTIFI